MKYFFFFLGLLISFLTIPSYASAITWNECVANPAYGTLGPNSCGTYVAWPVSDSSYYWLFSSPNTATKNTQTPSNYALYAQTCTEPPPPCETAYMYQIDGPTGLMGCKEINCSNQVVPDSFCEPGPENVFDNPICSDGEITEYGGSFEYEEGKDCGGICSADCIATCPPGTQSETVTIEDQSLTTCSQIVPASNYGMCPDLVEWEYNTDTGLCYKDIDPYLSANIAVLPAVEDPYESSSESSSSSSTTLTANPDGTVTKEITTTATESDGSGGVSNSTSTITEIYDALGELISSTTSGNTSLNTKTSDLIGSLVGSQGSLKSAIESGNSESLSQLRNANLELNQITGKLETINQTIIDTNGSPTQEDKDTAIDGLDTSGNTQLDTFQTSLDSEAQSIVDSYNPDTTLYPTPLGTNIRDFYLGIIPDPQECSPVTFSSPLGRSMTIPCKTFDMARMIFSWIISLLTVHALFHIFVETK